MIKVPHFPAVEELASVENLAEACHLRKDIPKCGESAAGILDTSSRKTQLGCHQADGIIWRYCFHEPFHRSFSQLGIGIENEKIFTTSNFYPLINSFGKTNIIRVLDQIEILGFLFINNSSCFISGSIVNDNYLKFSILISGLN